MAGLWNIIVAVWAFAVMAAAVPMNFRRDIVMVTITDFTTVDTWVTLMVDQNGVPFETIGPNAAAPATAPTAMATISTPVAVPSSPQVAASSPVAPSSPPTTMATMATTSSPVAAAPAPMAPSSSAAPAAAPSPASSGSGNSGAVSASATNMCNGEGDACEGDITHWDGGLGACGWNVDTSSDFAIALPYEFMGTLSNSNPYCKRSLTIQNPNTGAQVQAIVADKCMGCEGRSIDLTDALFNAIAPTCDGRCHDFVWWFN